MEEALAAWERNGHSRKRAAEELGIPEGTLGHRVTAARARLKKKDIEPPVLPDDDLPVEEIIDHLTKRYEKRIVAKEARDWIPIKINKTGPIAIAWVGDPHVDDNGCAWPVLREDLELIQKTDGMFAAILGDLQNGWTGRLTKLWAHQDTSAKTAWKLVEWLIRQYGDKLILCLKGNHDLWQGAGDPLDFLRAPATLMEDWQARLEFQFPNGGTSRVIAAHDFSGHSMWNPLHANQRKAKFFGEADLYVAGHRHEWALAHHEDGERHRIYWLARARGYKVIDSYAEQLGYGSQRYGCSVVSVFDPDDTNPITRLQCFANVGEAADYLKWKRSR